MKTIGVTGFHGRLGSYLVSHFPGFTGLECDVTVPESVDSAMERVKPDAVLHLAAKSGVDWCEKLKNEKEVTAVNLRGTYHVCVAAEKKDVQVILLSSDHVFSGNRGSYKETDKPLPVNQYGRSKLAAEGMQNVFSNLNIVRTSYFFDAQRLSNKTSGSYPTFFTRSFIYIHHLAEQLNYYFSYLSGMPSLLHLAGSETVSWYSFMQDANREMGWGLEILPRKHQESGYAANRPALAGLDVGLSYAYGFPQYSYMDGIRMMK